jgi:RNA polymerase sigma factor (sigma-70 family)
MNDDIELARAYAAHGCEQAFERLVSRHLGLVHSAALRQVRDPHLAEDITQTVFLILARKAGSLGPKTILPGWLWQTTRYVSAAALKVQRRRARREQAAQVQAMIQQSPNEPAWERLGHVLDEAMAQLRKTDRDAVLLRYFQNKSLREVGAALGVNEYAAQKRVGRALDRLRVILSRRGIHSTATAIAEAVCANSVQAAPAALVKATTAFALTKGAAASTSTLTILKGALNIMAWTKAKTVIVIGAVVLLGASTATVVVRTLRQPPFNPKDFWATSYPMGGAGIFTNGYGHPATFTFPVSPKRRCSVSGLLDECMEVTGWRYLIDKDVSAGSVFFGATHVMHGSEWVAAFERVLETGHPEWWDSKTKRMRQEDLILIRYPRLKTVLVLPRDKAASYR